MPGRGEPGPAGPALRRLGAVAAIALALVVGGETAAAQEEKGKPAPAEAPAKEGKKAKKGKGKPAGPPKLDAKAWILVDPLDDEVLAARSPGRERPIASTTKLMTAYLALERLKPKQVLKAPAYDALPAESIAGLEAGEKLTVKDLLYALLLPSANDAAAAIAVGVSGSEKKFVEEMNRSAQALGLDHTSYANPIGLDEAGNYSTPRDLVTLAEELMANDLFARIVDSPEAVLRSGSGKRRLTTRNTLLLSEPTVIGIKTGHTIQAGYVLVAAQKRNGTTLLSAVLGARSEAARDAESKRLLDYGFSQYRARRPVKRGQELADPELDYRTERISLVAKREVPVSIREGQAVRTRVTAPDEVEGPVERGETLGRVVVTVDGRIAGASPLVAAAAAPAASLLQKAVATVAQPIALLPAGLLVIVLGLLLAFRGRGEEDDPAGDQAPAAAPAPAEEPARPAPPPPPNPKDTEKPETEPKQPKGRRLRRERKPKGPRERTPEERRKMAMERAKRRKGRGR